MFLYEKERKIVTQVGSLPYKNAGKALEYSLKHDIPFLPELTAVGDSMFDYAKNPGNLACLEKFKEKSYSTAKVQCVGPIALMMSGFDESEAQYAIMTHITGMLDGLEADETILFLDEPTLGQTGMDYSRQWDLIFGNFDVIKGVHTCGNMQWDRLFKHSDIDIISFDASSYDITLYGSERNGKRIAWGIEKEEDIKDWKEGDLITLPCGMSHRMFKAKDCKKKLEMMLKAASKYK